MELGDAIEFFANVHLDGLNGATWDAEVAHGNFITFDRFITERSFGLKKRLFVMGGGVTLDPQYFVVRTPDGEPYLVVEHNYDFKDSAEYAATYLLQRCAYQAEIIVTNERTGLSGLNYGNGDSVVATVMCDVERVSAKTSAEFEGADYTLYTITLPGDTAVSTDNELRIDGAMYDIKEVTKAMNVVDVKAVKRG